MQIYYQWINPELALSYGTVRYSEDYKCARAIELPKKVFEPFNAEIWKDDHTLLNFFEGIGVLVQMRLIDTNLVRNLFSQHIIWLWDYMKPWIYHDGKRINDPIIYDSIEYLYNEMIKQRQQ